jgi:hypothetical protein
MKKLAEVQADAREKGGAAKETFDRLGLGADGYTASLSAVIKATADYYARTGDLSTVQDLLGRSAVTTREALDEIAQQSLPEFVNKMKDAGLVIESEGIKKMAEFNLMLEEGKVKMAGWGVNFVRNMSDAVKGWNMIRKAMLDGTGMGISDLSPEEMERFMGLGERARLRERPGVGSIQERVASQAEQKASKAMKDLETAELKQAQLVADTQEAGSSMLQFLSVVKSGESQMMQEAADRMRKESESLFNFVMAIGDPSQGLSGAREQRFSDLRRIGANEFGTGTTANKALDESQKSRAALEKLVTLIPQLPPNIASAIGTIRGIF